MVFLLRIRYCSYLLFEGALHTPTPWSALAGLAMEGTKHICRSMNPCVGQQSLSHLQTDLLPNPTGHREANLQGQAALGSRLAFIQCLHVTHESIWLRELVMYKSVCCPWAYDIQSSLPVPVGQICNRQVEDPWGKSLSSSV